MAASAVTGRSVTGFRGRVPIDQPDGKLLDGCWNPDGIVMDEGHDNPAIRRQVLYAAIGPADVLNFATPLNANSAPDVTRRIWRGPRRGVSTTATRPT
jgi:hypothetical protein